MQQYNVIAMTTVRPRQQQEQLCKTTIQTTIQQVAHLPVVDIDDATAATIATCVHLNSGPATFLIPRTAWKTKQGPKDHHNPAVTSNQTQQRPQPNNHQDFFLRFTRLKHVLLVPVPPITTRTRRRTTSQQEQQAWSWSNNTSSTTTHKITAPYLFSSPKSIGIDWGHSTYSV